MIQKYPTSIQDFGELRSNQYVYVDKTKYIYELATQGKYYFLSRPRRFGKSLLISTLECLFTAQKNLFEETYIYDKWNWDERFPVIRISFSNIGHKTKGLVAAIKNRLGEIASDYTVELRANEIDGIFKELIEKLHASYQQKVVVLIDEYDKPIIDYLGKDTEKAVANREIMKTFYSILKDADPHLKLVFITGVSKFARVSIFSDLNNLKDLTMHPRYGCICGISQQELEKSFKRELQVFDKEQIKEWYNGYTWDMEARVYNPFSLMNFFDGGKFQNFWFESGTPTFLLEMAKKNQLFDMEGIKASQLQLSAFDIENLKLLPVMFQTGYLTFKSQDSLTNIYTLTYPNLEVRQAFMESLSDVYIQDATRTGRILADELRGALLLLDFDKLKATVNSLFKSIPYEHWQKENEHFYHAILHLVFRLLGVYVDSQVHTADGRLDALVKLDNGIFCFEFKLDKTAEEALQQIIDKKYLEPYLSDFRPSYAIGINFSSSQKAVESILWKQI